MGKKNILVVDDDIDILELYKDVISDHIYCNLDISPNVSSAKLKISDNKYDVILSDILMPDQNGFQLLEYIQQRTPELPVILITGFREKRNAERAKKQNAFMYLEKPWNEKNLIQSINKALQQF